MIQNKNRHEVTRDNDNIATVGERTADGASKTVAKSGSPGWTRTSDIWINSPPFYQLNYRGIENFVVKNLDKFYINRDVRETATASRLIHYCRFRTGMDTK